MSENDKIDKVLRLLRATSKDVSVAVIRAALELNPEPHAAAAYVAERLRLPFETDRNKGGEG